MSVQKSQIELLDFYADWCGPCQQMKPVIEELEKELQEKDLPDGSQVTITRINVDKENGKASQYNIMSIPTFLIKKDGKIVDQLQGIQSKQTLLKKLS